MATDSSKIFYCEKCNMTCKTQTGYNRHIQSKKHIEKNDEIIENVENVENIEIIEEVEKNIIMENSEVFVEVEKNENVENNEISEEVEKNEELENNDVSEICENIEELENLDEYDEVAEYNRVCDIEYEDAIDAMLNILEQNPEEKLIKSVDVPEGSDLLDQCFKEVEEINKYLSLDQSICSIDNSHSHTHCTSCTCHHYQITEKIKLDKKHKIIEKISVPLEQYKPSFITCNKKSIIIHENGNAHEYTHKTIKNDNVAIDESGVFA